MKATQTINDWSVLYILGLELGLSSGVLDRIQQDNSKVLDCLRNMLSQWIDAGCASWAILVTALRSSLVQKKGLASEITMNHLCKCEVLTCYVLGCFQKADHSDINLYTV